MKKSSGKKRVSSLTFLIATTAVLAAVAGHEKDLTAAHIRAVLTLDRGQLSMPYGVTVLRESAALRFFKAASATTLKADSMGENDTYGQ